MRQRLFALSITFALLTAPLTVLAESQTATGEQMKALVSMAQSNGKEVVVKLRAGTIILVGDQAFPFQFVRTATLSGRIKETRENDFTLSSNDERNGEVTAVISYGDVLKIQRPPSGLAKVLKRVGKYSLLVPAAGAIVPLFGVLALMGRLPSC